MRDSDQHIVLRNKLVLLIAQHLDGGNKLKERVCIVLVQINCEIPPFPHKPEVRRLINSRVFRGEVLTQWN